MLSVDRPSTECRPITDRHIGQVSTNYRPSIGEVSGKCRRNAGKKSAKCRWTKSYIGRDTSGTTIGRVSTECRPTIDRLSTARSTDCRPTIDRVLTEYRPTVDRVSTDCRPSVDRLSTECRPLYRPLYRPISRSTLPTVNKIRWFYKWMTESTNEIIFLLMNLLVRSRRERLIWFDCKSVSIWTNNKKVVGLPPIYCEYSKNSSYFPRPLVIMTEQISFSYNLLCFWHEKKLT